MRQNQAILLVLIIFLFGIGLATWSYAFYVVKEVKHFDVEFNVERNVAGFNTDTDALKFGAVPPSGTGTRDMLIGNQYDHPVKAEITMTGEVIEYISITDNYFVLNPDESRKITFKVTIPEDAQLRTYTGKVRITLKRI